ncbi:MAG: anthranilate synthase component II [Geminicoccaceae bacterium]
MILLIDNYDSFTYNLYHYLGELGARTVVRRNDSLTVEEALSSASSALVISPGPCDPDRAGISVELVKAAAGRLPILGVCLGHQAIVQAFGGFVRQAPTVMHGKTSAIRHTGTDLFAGLPNPFIATRYHSLCALETEIPPMLEATAWSDDGILMGVKHRHYPIFGVQFHPESIETPEGHDLLRNFLTIVPTRQAA